MKQPKLIKVCGLRVNEASAAVAQLKGVDLLGFIFYPQSKRYAEETIDSHGKERVGIFVNASVETIETAIKDHSLTMVQLHGDETPAFCKEVSDMIPVIKAFGISEAKDLHIAEYYHDSVKYLLFDTKSDGYGGTGKTFDWRILEDYTGPTPFFISGGIGLDSLNQLKKFQHPKLAGIDLNSRFEVEPGVKNPSFINAFIHSYHA